ncbi:MAG: hypothetical protein P8017_17610 [Deltaproteobacteria bacterium]
MEPSIYRLTEYKIIEGGAGGLTWEAHFGFAAEQTGKCFRKGMILFIGPAESERLGYLKGDFFDHLKQYPEWSKTKYYCRGLEVFHCKTGKRVTEVEMYLWGLDQRVTHEEDSILSEEAGRSANSMSARSGKKSGAFRLRKYEMTRKGDDLVVWRTYAGPNIGRGGNCIILEDILFIGSWENERFNLIKRQFLSNLQRLPKWDQTRYFCPRLSLHDCKTGARLQAVPKNQERRSSERAAIETRVLRNRYKYKTGFNSRTSESSKDHLVFFNLWVKKGVTYAIVLMGLIIRLFFHYLIHFWKELKGRWDSRKWKGLFRS